MAKNMYQRQKDQKDEAKRRKKAEKLQRKNEKGSDTDETTPELDADGNEVVAEDSSPE